MVVATTTRPLSLSPASVAEILVAGIGKARAGTLPLGSGGHGAYVVSLTDNRVDAAHVDSVLPIVRFAFDLARLHPDLAPRLALGWYHWRGDLYVDANVCLRAGSTALQTGRAFAQRHIAWCDGGTTRLLRIGRARHNVQLACSIVDHGERAPGTRVGGLDRGAIDAFPTAHS